MLLPLYYYFYAFLVVVTPLVYSSLTGFEIPKVLLTRLLSVFFAILFFWLFLVNHKKIKFDKYDLIGVLWILFNLGSSILSGNFYNSFWGGAFRFQGVLTQICLVILFISTRKVLIIYPVIKKYLTTLLVASGFIQAVICFFQWIGVYLIKFDLATYSGRVVGTLGQPNFAASLILVSFAIIVYRKSIRYLFVSVLLFLSILVTGSVAELITFIVILIAKVWTSVKSKSFKLLLPVFMLILLIIFYAFWREIERKSFLPNPVESRINIWPESFKLFLKRPFVGYGAENLQFIFPDEFGGVSIDRAHNGFLDTLLVGGVFLGGIYMTIIYFGLKKSFISNKLSPAGFAFLALVMREQVGVNSIVNLIYFWILFAILSVQTIKLPSPKE